MYHDYFFFNASATTEIYTLSLHDALPIYWSRAATAARGSGRCCRRHYYNGRGGPGTASRDRKSTRLNSSHRCSSYAVFCLKKKKTATTHGFKSEDNLDANAAEPVAQMTLM